MRECMQQSGENPQETHQQSWEAQQEEDRTVRLESRKAAHDAQQEDRTVRLERQRESSKAAQQQQEDRTVRLESRKAAQQQQTGDTTNSPLVEPSGQEQKSAEGQVDLAHRLTHLARSDEMPLTQNHNGHDRGTSGTWQPA